LNAAGLAPGSTLYNFFFRDLQTVLDPGDPANHIYEAQLTHAVHVQNIINDTVVQDSAQDKLALAGRLRRLTAAGTFPVGPGTGTYAQFVPPASHGSLFDPTASLAATTEMQSEAIFFAATTIAPGGPFVRITNAATIRP
jgi:hypothetical protein